MKSKKRTQYLPDKVIADVLEAVIGASIVHSGEEGGAIAIHRFLGTDYLYPLKSYFSHWKAHHEASDDIRSRIYYEKMMRTIRQVEDTIDYRFRDIRYAVEAITHPSSLGPNGDGLGSCYQRLEYLGISFESDEKRRFYFGLFDFSFSIQSKVVHVTQRNDAFKVAFGQ